MGQTVDGQSSNDMHRSLAGDVRPAKRRADTLTRTFDVVVVGTGTAGLVAAVTLRRASDLRVAIVDRAGRSAVSGPEPLTSEGRALLVRLGLWRAFMAKHHNQALGQHAPRAQSAASFIYVPDQQEWVIERAWLERALATEARRLGVAVWPEAALVAARRTTPAHLTCVDLTGREINVCSRFVIDASGPAATYAQHQGASTRTQDRLCSATVRFYSDEPAAPPKVEPGWDGWWYADARPHGQLLVSFLTDPDIVQTLDLASLSGWWSAVDQTRATRTRVQTAWATSTPAIHSANCRRIDPIVGANWLAVDEAACSHPLPDQGVLRSARHGELAADVVRDELQGRSRLGYYAHRIISEHNRYMRALQSYYAGEHARWPRREFWRQRPALF